MFNRHSTAHLGLVSMAAILLWGISAVHAIAQCGGHGDMGGHNHAAAREDSHNSHSEHHYPTGALSRLVHLTPHGGRFLETRSHRLEVVYLPRQIRVYLYAKSAEPLSTLSLRGEMWPQVRGENSPQHIPLRHTPSSGPEDQDYLVAAADVGHLRDETPITFRFEDLPDRRHSEAQFTPIFFQSEIRPYVAQVSFVVADREGIVRQRVCPVTGARLGSMGNPIKVLVGDRPMYLCCARCIEKLNGIAGGSSVRPFPSISR